jgi:chemotaxis methyl-accepting protein methylase
MPFRTRRGGKFRHVVFAGAGDVRPGHVLDFAPPPGAGHVLDPPPEVIQLSVEEEAFLAHLFRAAGLDGRIFRRETLRRRLPACLRAIRACSPVDGRQILHADPGLVPRALSALVIGVSSFFRDAEVFDLIGFNVLPSICAGKVRPRVWSVGCSDGAELYSIAILLAEMGLLDGAYLLGTDCRADAVASAREGIFDARALRGVPGVWIDQYFSPVIEDGDRYQLRARLRGAAQWRTANVTRLQEPGQWDLILCRNMAMYLRPESSGRLWTLFEQSLRPGGYLVLGKAERPTGAGRLSMVGPCIYRRDRG